jgi:hypothetical protein
MQTKTQSFIEAVVNTAVGFLISLLTGQILYSYYSIPVSTELNFWFTIIFTVISIARSYVLRRIFNGMPRLCQMNLGSRRAD